MNIHKLWKEKVLLQWALRVKLTLRRQQSFLSFLHVCNSTNHKMTKTYIQGNLY
jgi:hypothetical protein